MMLLTSSENEVLTKEKAIELTKSKEQYPIDFDNVWQWCGYSSKSDAKKTLTSNFDKDFDFSVKLLKKPSRGRPSELIKLTLDCAKQFAMLAQTEKGKEVRKYFIEAEKEYRKLLEKELKNKYPSRTSEYKKLYKGLMDLMKLTNAKKHQYIRLQQALNRCVGNSKGRANLDIPPLLDYAYCKAMRATVKQGLLAAQKGLPVNPTLIKKLDEIAPILQSIQSDIRLLDN